MSKNRQLDLFVALIGDVPFRDEREAMSAPLVALSKNKRNIRAEVGRVILTYIGVCSGWGRNLTLRDFLCSV